MPFDAAAIAALPAFDLSYLNAASAWRRMARAKQLAPGVPGSVNPLPKGKKDWMLWLLNSGRGFGKTRTGNQWLLDEAYAMPGSILHAVARTGSDLRLTTFEGPAGLCSVIPSDMVRSYNRSTFTMRLYNDSAIFGFSAEEPNKLRGPQSHATLCDEVASWMYSRETWNNIIFSTRLAYTYKDTGRVRQPRIVVTTTPRPIALIRELRSRPDVVSTLGSSYENRKNLGEVFFSEIAKYEGTTIGRQEIHGELIDPEEAGVIRRSWLRLWPARRPLPHFEYIVASVDTAFSEETWDKKKSEADWSALTVWGVFDTSQMKDIKSKHRWAVIMLNCWRERLGMPELIERMTEEMQTTYGADRPVIRPIAGKGTVDGTGKKPDILVIEDKGSGISLRQMLAREDLLSYPYNPGRADKLMRLHAVSHIPNAGVIWVPESPDPAKKGHFINWASKPGGENPVESWAQEVCTYCGEGSTEFDDYVDSTSQAWRLIADRFFTGGLRKPADDKDDPPVQRKPNPYAN